jgi:uncharacterized protein
VDVSGSMDRYARFVMPFIMGLRGVGSRADVYVFSTSLTPITRFVRKLPLDKALDMISEAVPDWSGGTRIGDSLKQFNEHYGQKHLNKRTIAVIMSDGWDLGAKKVLRKEMETMAHKVHAVLWLNPLAGDPEYKPLCKGMQTVLPFVDHLLPADSLQKFEKGGKGILLAAPWQPRSSGRVRDNRLCRWMRVNSKHEIETMSKQQWKSETDRK